MERSRIMGWIISQSGKCAGENSAGCFVKASLDTRQCAGARGRDVMCLSPAQYAVKADGAHGVMLAR